MLRISQYRNSYNKVLKIFGVEEVTQLDSNTKQEFYNLVEKIFNNTNETIKGLNIFNSISNDKFNNMNIHNNI